MSQAIRDFERGDGPDVCSGYRRGDSWFQTIGPHATCEQKIVVVGPGIARDPRGIQHEGILVRCGGCLFSYVIL